MRSRFLHLVSLVSLLLLIVAGSLTWLSHSRRSVFADRASLMEIAHRYPNFSMAQRMALLRARQAQLHPRWRDLSPGEALRLLYKMATSSMVTSAPAANFSGNTTTIEIPSTDFLALSRQSDCSLTLRDLPYTLSSSLSLSYTIANSIPHYEQVLHQAAALTTTGGTFPAGCGDPVLGITARKIVYLGLTTSAIKVYAGTFYNGMLQQQQIFTLTAKADDTWLGSTMLSTTNSTNLATADLNGDGNGDLVSVTEDATGVSNATITVFLGNVDGTFQAPVSYQLPGVGAESAVIDDVNGDGKPDILASSESVSPEGLTSTNQITFLAGKGDGTFAAPRSFVVTPPANSHGGSFDGLITADLRGIGKKDLVSATGMVLLGNGDGTFTQSATPAFPPPESTSSQGPNVVAGDFNKDGKLDLAIGTGASVLLYMGAGDGTFTPGNKYGSISDIGALTATDLDGDGNVDLFVGFGNGGMVGGDNFQFGQGYALMGHGDGTFAGATFAPFISTGNNVADLNGDGIVDGVGVTATSTGVAFVSYLGRKDGSFAVKSTLTASPVTVNGFTETFTTIDSYGLGDVNGDGKADLVYISGYYDGVYVATGNGDGTFNAPVFSPTPPLVPPPDTDYGSSINSLFVADFNHDGKADVIYTFSGQGAASPNYFNGLAVQLSNGDGTFQAPLVIQGYSGNASPPITANLIVDQIGDVNGDGFPDLFTLQYTAPDAQGNSTLQLQLRLAKGDGTFLSPTLPAVADGVEPSVGISTYGPIALADMNGDGHIDIITLGDGLDNSLGNEVAISLGNGDGTFKAPIITHFDGYGALGAFLTIADFNGDGKLDVFTDGFDPPFDTGIYLGNGDGTLQNFTYNGVSQPALSVSLYVEGYALAPDFNGDGKPDIFAGGAALINLGAAAVAATPTTTTLTTSATTIAAGASVTFTAKVVPSSGTAIPTGMVAFANGTTQLGVGTLDATGSATFTTTSLATGSYSVVATYGGDSNFAASTSAAVSLTVGAAAPTDFALSLSPTSGTVAAGASSTSTVTVTPSGGFNQQIAFACSGAPAGGSCSFAPSSVTLDGSDPATTTLTIQTSTASAALQGRVNPGENSRAVLPVMFALLLGGGVFVFPRNRLGTYRKIATLFLVLVTCSLIQACGHSAKKPTAMTSTATVTVTATAGSISHSATYTLTVQ